MRSPERLGPEWFEVVREPWNEYIIQDSEDVPLKGKFVLTKMSQLRDPSKAREGLGMAGQTVLATYAPPSLLGKPSETLPSAKDISDEQKKRMDFKIVKEDWNIYRLPERKVTFKVRMIVSEVYRIPGYFGPDGDPYYIVESAVVVEMTKDPVKP